MATTVTATRSMPGLAQQPGDGGGAAARELEIVARRRPAGRRGRRRGPTARLPAGSVGQKRVERACLGSVSSQPGRSRSGPCARYSTAASRGCGSGRLGGGSSGAQAASDCSSKAASDQQGAGSAWSVGSSNGSSIQHEAGGADQPPPAGGKGGLLARAQRGAGEPALDQSLRGRWGPRGRRAGVASCAPPTGATR